MTSLKIRAGRALRRIAENDSRLENLIRKIATRPRVQSGERFIEKSGGRYTVVASRQDPDAAKVGIYLRGACDLPAMFAMAPLMREEITGTCCILRDPIQIAGSRSDFLLERLDEYGSAAKDAMEEAAHRLQLPPTYFGNELFSPLFEVAQLGAVTFPKTVVVLTTAPDFSRTLYRHRRHDFLVDPGGFWLNTDMGGVLGDPSSVEWFRSTFRSVGRMTTDVFTESFGRLVQEVRARTDAHIMVFNMLTVDPADLTHSYRLVSHSDTVRRRQFTIALAELSKEHDFDLIDADRVLKVGGISHQVDFAHFTGDQFRPLAEEAYRTLRGRQIL